MLKNIVDDLLRLNDNSRIDNNHLWQVAMGKFIISGSYCRGPALQSIDPKNTIEVTCTPSNSDGLDIHTMVELAQNPGFVYFPVTSKDKESASVIKEKYREKGYECTHMRDFLGTSQNPKTLNLYSQLQQTSDSFKKHDAEEVRKYREKEESKKSTKKPATKVEGKWS